MLQRTLHLELLSYTLMSVDHNLNNVQMTLIDGNVIKVSMLLLVKCLVPVDAATLDYETLALCQQSSSS